MGSSTESHYFSISASRRDFWCCTCTSHEPIVPSLFSISLLRFVIHACPSRDSLTSRMCWQRNEEEWTVNNVNILGWVSRIFERSYLCSHWLKTVEPINAGMAPRGPNPNLPTHRAGDEAGDDDTGWQVNLASEEQPVTTWAILIYFLHLIYTYINEFPAY